MYLLSTRPCRGNYGADQLSMSKDKSQLKAGVLRQPPLRAAVHLVAPDARYRHADVVRVVFDDASIRFSSISSSMTGADVYRSFTNAITQAFAEYPHAHTYVMCFDDKRHVPQRKAATQASRRSNMALSAVDAPEWTYDGTSAIVNAYSHTLLPPWPRVRLDPRAYRRALDDIAHSLLQLYVPPAGRRVIVDWSGGRRVVETTLDGGHVLAPYDDDGVKPRIGEADISAQYYAVRGRHDDVPRHRSTHSRALVPRPAAHATYYRESMSDVPIEQRHVAGVTRYAIETDVACRAQFEAGDVLLRSTDSDFVSLALAVEATYPDVAHSVHVALGAAYVSPTGEYCPSTTPGAAPRLEIVAVRELACHVRALHASEPACVDSLWSFVAFCIACGNDYTKRLHRFSHARFFDAYKYIARSGGRLARARPTSLPPLLDARVFVRFVRAAYFLRMPERKRPTSWDMDDELPRYTELAAIERTSAAPMPTLDELAQYFEQVCWSLTYASRAVHGVEHVPRQYVVVPSLPAPAAPMQPSIP